MTPAQKSQAKRRAKFDRLVRSLDVPKHYSINTQSISDADKTRLIQRGNAR